MQTKLIVTILISVVSLVVILATEPLYNIDLLNWSMTEIPKLQDGRSSFSFKMWETYSTVGLVIASVLPIGISFVYTTSQRPRAVYYTCYISAVFLVMNITKLAYWQARPFWAAADI